MSKDFRCPKCVAKHGMFENIPSILTEIHCQHSMPDAKDAEIARLKVDIAKLGLFNHGLQAYSDELKAENSRLRDALEEYAKPDNWQSEAHLGRYVVYKPFAEINKNHPAPWLKAREALASPPKEEK